MANSTIIHKSHTNSEVSSAWFRDSQWHKNSEKLEKIWNWQKDCESKYGFDPVSYFGGLSQNNQASNVKDTRFSLMFDKKLENKEKEKGYDLFQGLSEDDLIQLISYHWSYLDMLQKEQEKMIIKKQSNQFDNDVQVLQYETFNSNDTNKYAQIKSNCE